MGWAAWAWATLVYVFAAALVILLVFRLAPAPVSTSPASSSPASTSAGAGGSATGASGSTGGTGIPSTGFLIPPATWTEPVSLGSCLVYTFPATIVDGAAVPGAPTTDPAVVSQLAGSQPSACLYSNQAYYALFGHTCAWLGSTGIGSYGTPGCESQTGGFVPLGTYETFYATPGCTQGSMTQPCPGCTQLKPCPGELGFVSVGFFPQTGSTTPNCIAINQSTSNPMLSPCNITEQNQLFQIVRENVGALTSSTTSSGTSNRSGALTLNKFVNMETQQCLVPATSNPASGQLKFGPCSPRQGYVWLTVPSLPTPTGLSPPQIAYVGDRSISYIPNHPTELLAWLEKNTYSLVSIGTQLQLGPYFADGNKAAGYSNYVSQIIDYPLYQTEITGDVCSATNQQACFAT